MATRHYTKTRGLRIGPGVNGVAFSSTIKTLNRRCLHRLNVERTESNPNDLSFARPILAYTCLTCKLSTMLFNPWKVCIPGNAAGKGMKREQALRWFSSLPLLAWSLLFLAFSTFNAHFGQLCRLCLVTSFLTMWDQESKVQQASGVSSRAIWSL